MEKALSTTTGLAGSFIVSLFGGRDTGFEALLLFMGINFFSGLTVEVIAKKSTKTRSQEPVGRGSVERA